MFSVLLQYNQPQHVNKLLRLNPNPIPHGPEVDRTLNGHFCLLSDRSDRDHRTGRTDRSDRPRSDPTDPVGPVGQYFLLSDRSDGPVGTDPTGRTALPGPVGQCIFVLTAF